MSLQLNKTQSIKVDEDLIIEQDRPLFERLKDDLTCIICYGLLNKPTTCSKCETVFCEECIKEWLERYDRCPLNCPSHEVKLLGIPKNTKKLINRIRLKCHKGCEVEVLDYKEHTKKCGIETPIKCWNCNSEVFEYKLKEKVHNKEIKTENDSLRREIVATKKEYDLQAKKLSDANAKIDSLQLQISILNAQIEKEKIVNLEKIKKLEESKLIEDFNKVVNFYQKKEEVFERTRMVEINKVKSQFKKSIYQSINDLNNAQLEATNFSKLCFDFDEEMNKIKQHENDIKQALINIPYFVKEKKEEVPKAPKESIFGNTSTGTGSIFSQPNQQVESSGPKVQLFSGFSNNIAQGNSLFNTSNFVNQTNDRDNNLVFESSNQQNNFGNLLFGNQVGGIFSRTHQGGIFGGINSNLQATNNRSSWDD